MSTSEYMFIRLYHFRQLDSSPTAFSLVQGSQLPKEVSVIVASFTKLAEIVVGSRIVFSPEKKHSPVLKNKTPVRSY